MGDVGTARAPADGVVPEPSVLKAPARALSRQFVRHPVRVQFCVLFAVIVAVFILVAGGLGGFTDTDSFSIRSDIRTKLFRAVEEAVDVLVEEYASEREVPQQAIVQPNGDLFLLYRARGDTMLSSDILDQVIDIERRFTEGPNYPQFCLNENRICVAPTSFAGVNSSQAATAVIPQFDTSDTSAETLAKAQMYLDDAAFGAQRSIIFDAGFASPSLNSKFMRTYFPAGSPLEGFDSPGDEPLEQFLDVQDLMGSFNDYVNHGGLSTTGFDVILFGFPIWQIELREQLAADTQWGIGAAIFVFLFMWFHTQSLFLAAMGIIQILLSFPFALVAYHGVFGIVIFESLHSLAIFVILGIGADDIFVFVDAWTQTRRILAQDKDDLLDQMHYTFLRAAKAMLVTSATTIAAFLATSISSLIPIATFGLWAASLVFMNYLLVITFFPPALVIWERHLVDRERFGLCCCPRRQRQPSKHTSSSTAQESAQEPQMTSAEELSPAVESAPPTQRPTLAATKSQKSYRNPKKIVEEAADEEHQGGRIVERFFTNYWYPFILKARFVVLAVFLVLFVGAIVLTSQLNPLEEEEKFFPPDHFLEQAAVWQDEFLAAESDTNHEVTVAWGVEGIDQSGTNRYDPEDHGTVVWDETFQFHVPDAQERVKTACTRIQATDLIVATRQCFINNFETWLDDEGLGFPFVASGTPPAGMSADEYQRVEFGNIIERWSNETELGEEAVGAVQLGVVRGDDGVLSTRFVRVSFTATIDPGTPAKIARPLFEQWQALMTEINAGGPESANKAIQVSDAWLWMVVQDELVTGMFEGLAVSLSFAFFILIIATRNLWMAIISIVCVGGIIVSVFGALKLAGTDLGVSESISAVLIAGFAVDYCVHLAVHFVEAPFPDRRRRTKHAIVGMGISILAGCITTGGAALFLLGGVILFFDKMGKLLLSTVCFSLLWATCGFLALLITVGPEGDSGNIVVWWKTRCGRRPLPAKAATSESQRPITVESV